MTTPSIHGVTYDCNWPKAQTANAEKQHSARTFDPALNVAAHTYRPYNDSMSGRAADFNTMNGTSGLYGLGMAGLNASPFIALESNLRQVQWRDGANARTGVYDTMTSSNRSSWPSQFSGSAGTGCTVPGGSNAYTNTPVRGNTQIDRQRYLAALNKVYQGGCQ
jgi:hypothetical protein